MEIQTSNNLNANIKPLNPTPNKGTTSGQKMTQDEIKKHIEQQRLKLAQKVEKQKLEKKLKIEKEKHDKELEEKLALEKIEFEKLEAERRQKEEALLLLKQLSTIKEESTPAHSEANFEVDHEVDRDPQINNFYGNTYNNASTLNDRADSYFGTANRNKANYDKSPHYSDDDDFEDLFERDQPDDESSVTVKTSVSKRMPEEARAHDVKPNKLFASSKEKSLKSDTYDAYHYIEPDHKVEQPEELYIENEETDNSDRYRYQFEIKSQVENLKRKIQQQQKMKHQQNFDAKKAALAQIFKNKAKIDEDLQKANEVRDNLPSHEKEDEDEDEYDRKVVESVGPAQSEKIHNFEFKARDTPGFRKSESSEENDYENYADDVPQSYEYNLDLLKSQKFDQHLIRNIDLSAEKPTFHRSAKAEVGYSNSDDEIDDEVEDTYEDGKFITQLPLI